MKKYIVEALGTFTLTLVVALSLLDTFPVSTPVLAALVLMLFVYSVGHISGTHINPAVTIGLWSIKKIRNSDAINYIGAQFVGAVAAFFLASSWFDVTKYTNLSVGNGWEILFAEFLGMFFFAFGIASVVYDKTPSQVSGVVVGGSLLLGITISALLGSNGVLNPAVAFGIGSFSLMYVLGPVIGAVVGMRAYKALEN